MHYYLYEIRNNLNCKIYVGVHKTKNLDDGYMGSGKVVRRAITKHGIENFTKVILETFDTPEAMYAREAEVVNEEFLLREDVYNLRRGGRGGFDYINSSDKNGSLLGVKAREQLRETDWVESWKEKQRIGVKQRLETLDHTILTEAAKKAKATKIEKYGTLSFPISDEGLSNIRAGAQKRKHLMTGSNNPAFGKQWVTNGIKNKMVNKELPLEDGWKKGKV